MDSIQRIITDGELIRVGNASNFSIPNRTRILLYVSDGDPNKHSSGVGMSINFRTLDGKVEVKTISPDEPSTIYTRMPVRTPVAAEDVPRPPYYPTYAGLTPEQKWVYLNWLRDITQPINIGFVFIYYYGLERRMIAVDDPMASNLSTTAREENSLVGSNSMFDLAFDEIRTLQRHHSNLSFRYYSNSALLHACIFRKRRDKLEELYKDSGEREMENSDLLIARYLRLDLTPTDLFRLPKKASGLDKKKLKVTEDEYLAFVRDALVARFEKPTYPLWDQFGSDELPLRNGVLFANISFPTSIRSPQLPSFFDHSPFIDDVKSIMSDALKRSKKRRPS